MSVILFSNLLSSCSKGLELVAALLDFSEKGCRQANG
jgi:hypothetical protein